VTFLQPAWLVFPKDLQGNLWTLGEYFTGRMLLLVTNQQCQSTEWYSTEVKEWLHYIRLHYKTIFIYTLFRKNAAYSSI